MSPPRLPERSIRANPVRPAPKRSDSRRFGEGPPDARAGSPRARHRGVDRSEEHTSELQSLMRISYAVFCLKKKNKKTTNNKIENTITHRTITYNQHLTPRLTIEHKSK